MRTLLLSIGALLYAATSVSGHAILLEPPPRDGMGTELGPNGRKLQGENKFRNLPENLNIANSGCGNAQTTGNKGPGTIKVTWKAGEDVKICWKTTIAHPEQAGVRSPGIRVSIAYTAAERFDTNVLIKDKDGGTTGTTYCMNVKLPANKNCPNGCVLQWAWVSIPDRGAYLACADIRILPASNSEGCKASVWMGPKNSCTQAHGMYDLSPMEAPGAHPPGPAPIRRACSQGTRSNWGAISGSHGQYLQTITNKQDIVHNGIINRRLGPGAGCPQNAQTPPDLPPAPAPTQPKPGPVPPTQPKQPGPIQPTQPKQPQPTVPVGPGNCASNENTGGLTHSTLPYPVYVKQTVQNGATIQVPCSSANQGYVSNKATHVGFTVRCTNGRFSFVTTNSGLSPCAKVRSCIQFESIPSSVCGSMPFSNIKRNNFCMSGECTPADCCVGGDQLDMCDSSTAVSLIAYQTAASTCNANTIVGRGDIIADGKCRKFDAGGSTDNYYRINCRNNLFSGSWSCSDNGCTTCATDNFLIRSSDVNGCNLQPFMCTSGLANSCQSRDFRVVATIRSSDFGANAGTTMTTSILGVVAGIIMAII